jgi:hypothetical protein
MRLPRTDGLLPPYSVTVRPTGTRGFFEGSGGAVVRTADRFVAPDNGKKSLLGGLVASGLPLATAAGLPTAAGLAAALALAPAVTTTTARESATLLARLLLWLAAALLARWLLRLVAALLARWLLRLVAALLARWLLRLAPALPFWLRLAGTLLAGLLLTAVFASGMSHASSFKFAICYRVCHKPYRLRLTKSNVSDISNVA